MDQQVQAALMIKIQEALRHIMQFSPNVTGVVYTSNHSVCYIDDAGVVATLPPAVDSGLIVDAHTAAYALELRRPAYIRAGDSVIQPNQEFLIKYTMEGEDHMSLWDGATGVVAAVDLQANLTTDRRQSPEIKDIKSVARIPRS